MKQGYCFSIMHGVLLGRKQAGARENHFSCSLRIAADRNGNSNRSPDSDHVTWQALDVQCSMKAFLKQPVIEECIEARYGVFRRGSRGTSVLRQKSRSRQYQACFDKGSVINKIGVAGFEFPARKIQPCFQGLFFLKIPPRSPFRLLFLPVCYDRPWFHVAP